MKRLAALALLAGCHGGGGGAGTVDAGTVDARTIIPPHSDGGPIVMTDEQALGDPVVTAADRAQESPAVGWTGVSWLVAFEDDYAPRQRIQGVRIAPDGALLDAAWIDLAPSPYPQRAPQIACSPAECLVVWRQALSPQAPLRQRG